MDDAQVGTTPAVEVNCGDAFKSEQERANFFVEQNVILENKVQELEDIIVQAYAAGGEVQIRYGTRDTIFEMYPIDSAEVAVGYLKTNGAFKDQ